MRTSITACLTLMLTLAMILWLPPVVGAVEKPINNVQDLQNMKNDLHAIYYLSGDIDASATAGWNSGAGFEPIGTSVNPFTGQLDGKGHVVTGLTINRPNLSRVGMFGYTKGAHIQNIGMEGAQVKGNGDVGGLVGSGNDGTQISNGHTAGTISGSNINVGGLLGSLNSNSRADNAYSRATVSAASNGGGLVGRNNGGAIVSCYSTGAVTGSGFLGGLVGNSVGGTTASSYWDLQTSGRNASAGGTGKSTAEMMQQTTFVGWNFSQIWSIRQNAAYPALRVFETGLGNPPPGSSNDPASVPGFTPYGIGTLSLLIVGSKVWLVRRKKQQG